MNREEFTEACIHLRRIHFFILIASIACFAIVYGYKNQSIDLALTELKQLVSHYKTFGTTSEKKGGVQSIVRSNNGASPRTNSLVNSANNQQTNVARFHNVPGIERALLPSIIVRWNRDSLLEHSEEVVQNGKTLNFGQMYFEKTTYVDELDRCLRWGEIARTETDRFTAMLSDKSILPNIWCEWVSEDELLVIATEYTKEFNVNRISSSQGPSKVEYNRERYTIVSSAEELSSCYDYSSADEDNKNSLSSFVKDLQWPGYCRWDNDSQTFAWFEVSEFKQSAYLVSEDYVTSVKDLFSFVRISSNSFETSFDTILANCNAFKSDEEKAEYLAKLTVQPTTTSAEIYYHACIDNRVLASVRIDWDKNSHIEAEHRDLYVQTFEDAFPNLYKLYILNRGDDSFVSWSKVKVVDLRSKLNEKLLDIGQTTIAGLPIKQDVLLYGGPPLLVIMQIYFLLHFNNFLTRFSDRRFFIPWIGLYVDKYSQLVTTGTVVILPPAAMLIFAHATLSIDSYKTLVSMDAGIKLTATVLSILMSILQFSLFKRYWALPNSTDASEAKTSNQAKE